MINPIFGLKETVADGEPHVFGNRLYVYGSHDVAGGDRYCPGDYVVYSADLDDLNNWRYEGVSFKKSDDPDNRDGKKELYAPDVVEGNDGLYYLYYFLNGENRLAVARSSSPAGPFVYYGDVHYPEGMSEEQRAGLPLCFDPSVINVDGHIYLAYGFSVDFKIEGLELNEKNTRGGFVCELSEDMLQMLTVPVLVIPGVGRGQDSSFRDHEFLEASSLRYFNGHYYFIYSSQAQHELCYGVSESAFGPYEFGGVLVSNAYEERLRNNWANNHGSVVCVRDKYFIFYHRHTYGTQFSRQECLEPIEFDGLHFKRAKMSSGVLTPGTYGAGVACFVCDGEGVFLTFNPYPLDRAYIRGEEIVNIRKSSVVLRYLRDCQGCRLYFGDINGGSLSISGVGVFDLEECVEVDDLKGVSELRLDFDCDGCRFERIELF